MTPHVHRFRKELEELGLYDPEYKANKLKEKTLQYSAPRNPFQAIFTDFAKHITPQIASSKTEGEELKSLKKEIMALRKRLDTYAKMFTEARKIEREIKKEIAAIEVEATDSSTYKPEDWLPSGKELEKLFEEE